MIWKFLQFIILIYGADDHVLGTRSTQSNNDYSRHEGNDINRNSDVYYSIQFPYGFIVTSLSTLPTSIGIPGTGRILSHRKEYRSVEGELSCAIPLREKKKSSFFCSIPLENVGEGLSVVATKIAHFSSHKWCMFVSVIARPSEKIRILSLEFEFMTEKLQTVWAGPLNRD